MTCEPRILVDDVEECLTNGIAPDRVEEAIEIALELFDKATQYRYIGPCEATVRPCLPRSGCGCTFAPCGHENRVEGLGVVSSGCCGCGSAGGCGCVASPVIRLPHVTAAVTAITVDGEDLPPTAWFMPRPGHVARSDGRPWPLQDLSIPDGAPGSWSITYTYGRPLPLAAKHAIKSMIREIAKGLCGQACSLPRGMRIIVSSSGVPFPEYDRYRDQTLTGYPLVDDWITLDRGGHTHIRPSVTFVRSATGRNHR